jgi:hypothetical protein
MPHMDFVIKLGDLNKSQRAILEVVERHSDNMWSTSASDLKELASWAAEPSSREAPLGAKQSEDDLFNEETPGEVVVKRGRFHSGHIMPTYSLKTVKTALRGLSDENKIWCFKLYDRTYYASHESKRRVKEWLRKLPSEQFERAGFKEYVEE